MGRARAGKSISALVAERGETAFREVEQGVIRDIEKIRNHVVAVGVER